MIYIFHGDNQSLSRSAFTDSLRKYKNADLLEIDAKSADENQISQFLNSQSFLATKKIVAITSFFSIPKAKIDKIVKTINSSDGVDILIWQDKTLTTVQLKTFPLAKIEVFKADNVLFSCLNQIRPHNLKYFLNHYHQVIDSGLYDLFLYMLKNNLRRKLIASQFHADTLKKVYLNLIELDYQNKTGTLSIPKEIALERLMIKLLS